MGVPGRLRQRRRRPGLRGVSHPGKEIWPSGAVKGRMFIFRASTEGEKMNTPACRRFNFPLPFRGFSRPKVETVR